MWKVRSSKSGRWSFAAFVVAALALAASDAEAGKFKVLHSFCGTVKDGCNPAGGLTIDAAGNLFGTTAAGGGTLNDGTAFVLKPADTGKLKYHLLFTFCKKLRLCGGAKAPIGNVIVDTQGNLYGVSGVNGDTGTVFELVAPTDGSTKWTQKVLYRFCSQQNCADGASPVGGLAYAGQASGTPYDGTSPLYGATELGGTKAGGTVFKLSSNNGQRSETVLHNFCPLDDQGCTDGKQPLGGVAVDQAGNLFGTTEYGGANQHGIIYQLSPNGNGSWAEVALYAFCAAPNCSDGAEPVGNLVVDRDGNLFGVTAFGGRLCNRSKISGCGTIFKITPKGAESQETVLYAFCTERRCRDGLTPLAGLALEASGDLLGTTWFGGGHDSDYYGQGGGTVFEFSPSAINVLHGFCAAANCADGEYPTASVLVDSTNSVYGTTSIGGNYGGGTVFRVSR